MKIFFDADCLFSAHYSKTGGARHIVDNYGLELFSSDKCITEAKIALERYNSQITKKLQNNFKTLNSTNNQKFKHLIYDKFDLHVVSTCLQNKMNYLITYNLKDYNIEELQSNYNLIVINPGDLIMLLRAKS